MKAVVLPNLIQKPRISPLVGHAPSFPALKPGQDLSQGSMVHPHDLTFPTHGHGQQVPWGSGWPLARGKISSLLVFWCPWGNPAGKGRGAWCSLLSTSLSAWATLVQQVAAGQVAEQSHPSQSTHPDPPWRPGTGGPSLLWPREGGAAGRREDPSHRPSRAPQWGGPHHHRHHHRHRRGRATAQDRQQSTRQQGRPAEVAPSRRQWASKEGSREEGATAGWEDLSWGRLPLPWGRGTHREPRLSGEHRWRGTESPTCWRWQRWRL